MSGGVEMRLAVHSVSPLRVHDPNAGKMTFNSRSRSTRMECRVVDEEGLLLNGCIRYEVESGNLILCDAKVFKSRDRCFGSVHY